jgi:arginyl-tRNA synthetase
MEDRVEALLKKALVRLRENGSLPPDLELAGPVERPRREEFGDFGTALPLAMAKALRLPPARCAEMIQEVLDPPEGLFQEISFAPPGYLNFRVRPEAWWAALQEATSLPRVGGGERVLLEFVSANPTGPLHVGHGRGAVLGDALARLMRATDYAVETEYYVNDVGNQMAMLGLSLHARGREALGLSDGSDFPENGYRGQYIREIAARWVATPEGEAACRRPYEDLGPRDDNAATAVASRELLEWIRRTLGDARITFDHWFHERPLHRDGEVQRMLDSLLRDGKAFRDDSGAILFRMEGTEDSEDRVLVRGNGMPTYFAADVAYHHHKFLRGFQRLINIWGADHHGYIPRVRASLEALGHDPGALQVLLVQMVTLTRGGVAVPMGKRSGEFVTLQDVLDEVGTDAVRFLFLLRRPDAQMEFDLDLARSQSLENPVYYVQYGHARVASIVRRAAAAGVPVPPWSGELLAALSLPEEAALTRDLVRWPGVVGSAARRCEPHHVAFYLLDLVKAFHGYYTRYRHTEKVLSADPRKTAARLYLVSRIRNVLHQGLSLLGVSAPDEMRLPEDDETA